MNENEQTINNVLFYSPVFNTLMIFFFGERFCGHAM